MPFTRSTSSNFVARGMDKLRRSFRDSFRGRRGSKDPVTEASKPHEWQQDEAAVRAGTCSFHVKYLGCVEVFESRGMQVCEEALKVLRQSRKRRIRGILYVSGDGLRVVDAENKGLVVDQTIEKVSFCAPDRNHERGFGYICRDGTTRRWMCHGFHAVKESGERLSHAVGCAFAVCLEKKQKRDRDAATNLPVIPTTQSTTTTPATVATVTTDVQETRSSSVTSSNFVRQGSFKHASLTERILDPQNVKPAERPPIKPVVNPHAVSRPSANPSLFERQGSLRIDSSSDGASPFKRNFSLRLNELPSNLSRQEQQPQQSNGLSSKPLTSVSILEAEEHYDAVNGKTRALVDEFAAISSYDKPVANAAGFSSSPALSTASSSRSRADEWLESAANTANQMRQYNRQTPPAGYSNSPAAMMTPPLSARGGPVGFGSGSSTNSTTNGFSGPSSSFQTAMPPFTTSAGLNASGTATEVDMFGQPVFAAPPVPQRQQFGRRGSSPPLAQRNFQRNVPGTRSMGVGKLTHQPASLDFHIGREVPTVDPFEAKWSALSGKGKNPFNQESSTVHI